jgi:membrane protease YdiL (CAAX protease family)
VTALARRVPLVAVLAGGLGLLVLRPTLVVATAHPLPVLVAIGVGIAAAAIAVPVPTDPVGSPMSSAPVLGIGLVGVLIAAATAGRPVPTPFVAAAPVLNTLAAVAEEALFRRVAYSALRPGGAALAVTGSALAFALLHVPLYGLAVFPVDLGAGLLLSWQRWASGRWTVPAATHAAANLLAVIR